jgi:hypothetical protein
MRDSPVLDNGSVNMFPWQLIEAVSDELFEMVIYGRFASKLQKRSYSQLQFSSQQSSEEFRVSPAEQIVQKLQQELLTRLLFVCNRFVK